MNVAVSLLLLSMVSVVVTARYTDEDTSLLNILSGTFICVFLCVYVSFQSMYFCRN